MGNKKYVSSKNGVTRKVRSKGNTIQFDKFTSRSGSKKGKDHSGMILDFGKGIVKIFGSGENLGKK